MSVHAALEATLPGGAIAPKRFDDSVFCGFEAFDSLRPQIRRLLAVRDHRALFRCGITASSAATTPWQR